MLKQNLRYVEKYRKIAWDVLGAVGSQMRLRNIYRPIISPYEDDELAKRFDIVMYTISCILKMKQCNWNKEK